MHWAQRNPVLHAIALHVPVRGLAPIGRAHRYDQGMHAFDVVQVDVEVTDRVRRRRDLLRNGALRARHPPAHGCGVRLLAAGAAIANRFSPRLNFPPTTAMAAPSVRPPASADITRDSASLVDLEQLRLLGARARATGWQLL